MKIFTNIEYFTESARFFQKHGTYCLAPYGTSDYLEYWKMEIDRCRNGYKVGDTMITGDHYYYINFCPIKRVFIDDVNGVKKLRDIDAEMAFPDFRDGNYQFFWVKDIALKGISQEDYNSLDLGVKINHLEGGKNLCVVKARQKGFSFMNAAILCKRYMLQKKSLSATTAYDKKFVNSSMDMFEYYMNFQNQHCGWRKPNVTSKKREYWMNGRQETVDGIEVTTGYQSEVYGFTLKDNPDALRGKSKALILIEEIGTFKTNLKDTLAAMEPITMSGDHKTGQIILFGTGGGKATSWADAKDVFYNSELYNMLEFENTWEDNNDRVCGYYYPNYLAKEGFSDKQGNSEIKEAKESDYKIREKKKKASKNMRDYALYVMEYSHTPSESFMQAGSNMFPVAEMAQHLSQLESSDRVKNASYVGEIISDPKFPSGLKWVTSDNVTPISKFPISQKDDSEGCVVIWEQPERLEDGSVPYGVYIAGIDPYEQDETTGDSLGSCLIYKQFYAVDKAYNLLVAELTGRPATAEEYYEKCRILLQYYNAVALHENNNAGLKNYFQNKQSLNLLRLSPKDYISSIMPGSKVDRSYGMHMETELTKTGNQLIKSWLLEDRGDGTKNLHNIYSIPLLQELIAYSPEKGNYDRIAALRMLMFHRTANFFITKVPDKLQHSTFFDTDWFK